MPRADLLGPFASDIGHGYHLHLRLIVQELGVLAAQDAQSNYACLQLCSHLDLLNDNDVFSCIVLTLDEIVNPVPPR